MTPDFRWHGQQLSYSRSLYIRIHRVLYFLRRRNVTAKALLGDLSVFLEQLKCSGCCVSNRLCCCTVACCRRDGLQHLRYKVSCPTVLLPGGARCTAAAVPMVYRCWPFRTYVNQGSSSSSSGIMWCSTEKNISFWLITGRTQTDTHLHRPQNTGMNVRPF